MEQPQGVQVWCWLYIRTGIGWIGFKIDSGKNDLYFRVAINKLSLIGANHEEMAEDKLTVTYIHRSKFIMRGFVSEKLF